MKLVIGFRFLCVSCMLQLLLGVATFSSCSNDSSEVMKSGKMGETFWVSDTNAVTSEYSTIKFSGKNSCRYRQYVTPSVDIDHRATYSNITDDSLVVKEGSKVLGSIKLKENNTLVFIMSEKNIIFNRQNIH